MPRTVTITFSDGSSHVYQSVPDAVTPEAIQQRAEKDFGRGVTAIDGGRQAPEQGFGHAVKKTVEGAALGISDLGNTVLNVATYLPGKVIPEIAQWNRTRNADFDALTEQNKDSTAFNVGRVGGNVAVTLPVGGVLGAGVKVVAPGAVGLSNAIATGGMRTGVASGAVQNALTRALGGAITGGASAGLVHPEDVGTGALVGGALPGAVKVAGLAGNKLGSLIESGAERLMRSAIKPTIKQLQTGDAATAVRTLLDLGINPTAAGVNKLRDLIGSLNDEISSRIASSPASVDKQAVLNRLGDVRNRFTNQVSPTADLNAIQGVADDFAAHPSIPGSMIPVQLAQDLKQGTYRVLSKKYGQLGSAEVEAQKGLARGLKEEISNAVPEIAGLNAQESKLITTLDVAERRALMELNKNPFGLALLAKNPAALASFMADRSALFKSLTARLLNNSTGAVSASGQLLENGMTNPLLRNATTISVERNRE